MKAGSSRQNLDRHGIYKVDDAMDSYGDQPY